MAACHCVKKWLALAGFCVKWQCAVVDTREISMVLQSNATLIRKHSSSNVVLFTREGTTRSSLHWFLTQICRSWVVKTKKNRPNRLEIGVKQWLSKPFVLYSTPQNHNHVHRSAQMWPFMTWRFSSSSFVHLILCAQSLLWTRSRASGWG